MSNLPRVGGGGGSGGGGGGGGEEATAAVDRLAQENEKWTRACSEGLTASQSAPDGSYGPYDHIISMGNA